MNSTTWIIEPNEWVWILFGLASVSHALIAFRLWYTPKNAMKQETTSQQKASSVGFAEIYKTTILTIWLAFSAWLMWQVYSNHITSSDKDLWSNLIAIIGIIVATLIGWQIYSAMDWNSKVDRLSKIERMYDKLSLDVEGSRNYSEATFLAISATNMLNEALKKPLENKTVFIETYKSFLQAIKLYGSSSVEESIESCISYLFSLLDYMRWYEVEMDADFHAHCETLYDEIKKTNRFITKAQLGKLKLINQRRNAVKNGISDEE